MKRNPIGFCFLALALVLAGCGSSQPSATTPQSGETQASAQNPSEGVSPAAELSLGRNAYVVVDDSGSMGEGACGGGGETKMSAAKSAIQEFLKKVPESMNLGLYILNASGWSSSGGEVVPLGSGNRSRFIDEVAKLRDGGGTPLCRAMHQAAGALRAQYAKQGGFGEYRLIVVTDGQATDGDIDKAVREVLAQNSFIQIHAIGLCMSEDHALRRYAISYRNATSPADLKRGLEETLAESPAFDPTAFK